MVQPPLPDSPPPWPGVEVFTERLRLFVRRSGPPGAPAVMLLHGYGVHGGMFEGVRDALEPSLQLIVPDLRGHGLSDTPDDGYTAEEMADDLAALLDRLDIPRLHVVGYSMGGFVAQAFAQRHSDRVDRLALLCTAPSQGSARQRLGLAAMEATFRVVPPAAMRVVTTRLLAGPNMPDEKARILLWLLMHNTRRGLSGGAALLRRAHLESGLHRITMPTLVVTAEHDVAISPQDSRRLLDALPHARHEHFADAGHGLAMSHRRQLGTLLADFLAPEPRP